MIVQNKKTGEYLGSPLRWNDGDVLWEWFSDIKSAHVFPNRSEAKVTLKYIHPMLYTNNKVIHQLVKISPKEVHHA